MRKELIKKVKRVVVKIGSTALRVGIEKDENFLKDFVEDILAIKSKNIEVVLVSSGAMSMGLKKMNLNQKPDTIPKMQAIASVGQVYLMAEYENTFESLNAKCGQILLTHDDLSSRKRFLNARNTMNALCEIGATAIINENDSVAVEEIKYGDNDRISAIVTNIFEADLLIMLTDKEGVYDDNPETNKEARLIDEITDIDSFNLTEDSKKTSKFGSGGIYSKIKAGKEASHFGSATIIASAFVNNVLSRILDGEKLGTFITPMEDKLTSKKHWIAYSSKPSGSVTLDKGAVNVILNDGKSLLPTGIISVKDTFEAGDVIHCLNEEKIEIARGVTNYSSNDILSIKGCKSIDIEGILGFKSYDEVIHRDNLVVL